MEAAGARPLLDEVPELELELELELECPPQPTRTALPTAALKNAHFFNLSINLSRRNSRLPLGFAGQV
jgi:hypothetical protein